MPDHSHLDRLRFIDATVFNCPFCNRKHVPYEVYGFDRFDWTESKRCTVYTVICTYCKKTSMYLSYRYFELEKIPNGSQSGYRFVLKPEESAQETLNSEFFYSVPTSFFELDNRIPRVLREPFAEAEGCLKSGFLTGGSACARKVIYELCKSSGVVGKDYEERIAGLKEKYPDVGEASFDLLAHVHSITSSKVHEHAYDGWESKHLKAVLGAVAEVMHEIFVLPAEKLERRKAMQRMRDELVPPKTEKAEPQDS